MKHRRRWLLMLGYLTVLATLAETFNARIVPDIEGTAHPYDGVRDCDDGEPTSLVQALSRSFIDTGYGYQTLAAAENATKQRLLILSATIRRLQHRAYAMPWCGRHSNRQRCRRPWLQPAGVEPGSMKELEKQSGTDAARIEAQEGWGFGILPVATMAKRSFVSRTPKVDEGQKWCGRATTAQQQRA
jgi:hypothetical protein